MVETRINTSEEIWLFTNFGSDKEHQEILTLQLEPTKREEYTMGEVVFEE